MAPVVAGILAEELGRDEAWEKEQIEQFTATAKGYYLDQ
jgi:glycerol-3-phosphate dehydrogenase